MRLLRFPEVRQLVGLSRSAIWNLEQKNLFPKRRQIGLRSVGWSEAEITAWLSSRKQIKSGGQ